MLTIERVQLIPIVVKRRTGIQNLHVVVKLEASGGHVGWGEMSDLSHLPMYQFDLEELQRALNDLLAGKDARNLARIEDEIYRFYPNEGHKYSRSGLVREGIDLALHDLLGRVDGVSVSTLLGGQLRDRIKVCYPIFRMRSAAEIEPNLARVQEMLDLGFDLIRVYVGHDGAVDEAFLGAFSDRFGGRVAIKSLDFSNFLSWRNALQAAERYGQLADFLLLESVAYENDYEGMAEFRRRSKWPISEHVNHLNHGWQLLHGGVVDILNVSPYVVGGLRAAMRIIGMAEAAHASVLIGTTQELNLGTAAVAHLGAAARVLDYPSDNTGPYLYTDDVVKQPLQYERGHLLVPDGIGLGVDVDEEQLAAKRVDMRWTFGSDLTGLLDRTTPTEA